ncbi:MAG: DUF1552 domain-containing protein [Lentisphaeraceae bacterium]|nr:DUF1552 domain-containing protein [Lentisphaeraceae bacterium]
MSKKWQLNRRTALKAAGISLGLPFLEVMGAGDSSSKPPQRFMSLYFPNGVYPGTWQNSGQGKSFKLGKTLEPFNPIKNKVNVVNKLTLTAAGGHIVSTIGYLNGVIPKHSNSFVRSKVSIDQMIAQKHAKETFLPSLHLGVEAPLQGVNGGIPKSHGNSISRSASGYKIEPELAPLLAFDSLFGHHDPKVKKMTKRRQFIVDGVWAQAKDLSKQVSKNDKGKLEQYFDSLRAVEMKLEKTINPPKKNWQPRTMPKLKRPEVQGIPDSHEEYTKLMLDILLLGIWTDTTRVATMMYGVSISQINYDFLKNGGNHHAMSHNNHKKNKVEGFNNITKWFSTLTADLLMKMDQIDEGNGSLLDNSLVMFGSGIADGNVHENFDIPILLAGGAGGRVKTARSIDVPGTRPHGDILHTILHKFDISVDNLHAQGTKTVLEF